MIENQPDTQIHNKSTIKILQLNLENSAISNETLLNHLHEDEYDVLLLQEPYSVRGKLIGLNTAPHRCLLSKGCLKPG